MKGLLLLEGADSSGKSTLARYICSRYNARYLHSTAHAPGQIWRWHLAALNRALKLAETQLVVMDRLWHSEQIYGPIFRGRPGYDAAGARVLDRILMKHAALTILCVPSDLRGHEARWARDRAAGKREMFDRVREVIVAYYDLARGNVERGGDGYTDQLSRYSGGLRNRFDVLVYDLDRDTPERFTTQMLTKLERLRAYRLPGALAYRRQNLLGSDAAARVAIVGDRVSPSHDYRYPYWPFVSPNFADGSTGYLNRALHDLRFDETRAVWTNANEPRDDWLDALLARPELRIVALGTKAAETLKKRGRDPDRWLCHPQSWRRFHYHDRAGYARVLREALG